MLKYKNLTGPHHRSFQGFFDHYRHLFYFEGVQTMLDPRNKAHYTLAYLWCWDRWGTGGDAGYERACAQTGPYVHDWMYNSADGEFLIHDDNHAFEFRMRWC